MSAELSGIASRKIAGGVARRCLLRCLSDQANNDGSGIYGSVRTLARDSELSERTVQTHLKAFVKEGLLRFVGQRECRYGYTNEYAINLVALEALPDIPRDEDAPVKEPRQRKSRTGEANAPVKERREVQEVVAVSETTTKPSGEGNSPGETAAPVQTKPAEPAKENSPDPYKKTTSPSLRSGEVAATTLDLLAATKSREPRFAAFDALWALWRERDLIRRSRKQPSLEAFKQAIKAGANPDRILAGARTYLANPDKNKDRGQFMLGLVKWLEDQEWEEWADDWEGELRRRKAMFEHDGFWDSKWGPKPAREQGAQAA